MLVVDNIYVVEDSAGCRETHLDLESAMRRLVKDNPRWKLHVYRYVETFGKIEQEGTKQNDH